MPKLKSQEDLPGFDVSTIDIDDLQKSKGGRMQLNIIESAIKNIGKIGIENITYASIAKEAGVNKSHVAYYFADKSYIFEAAIKIVNDTAQNLTSKNVLAAEGWENKLIAIIDSSLEWLQKYPHHTPVLLQYFQRCAVNKLDQVRQTKVRNIGRFRLEELIKIGVISGQIDIENTANAAEKIQVIISGYIFEFATTKRFKIKEIRSSLISAVSQILQYNLKS